MSKWDKLIAEILSLSNNLRFEELRRVLKEGDSDEENDR